MRPGDMVRLSRHLSTTHATLPHPDIPNGELGGSMRVTDRDMLLVLKTHRIGEGDDDVSVTLLGPRGGIGLAWIEFLEVVG